MNAIPNDQAESVRVFGLLPLSTTEVTFIDTLPRTTSPPTSPEPGVRGSTNRRRRTSRQRGRQERLGVRVSVAPMTTSESNAIRLERLALGRPDAARESGEVYRRALETSYRDRLSRGRQQRAEESLARIESERRARQRERATAFRARQLTRLQDQRFNSYAERLQSQRTNAFTARMQLERANAVIASLRRSGSQQLAEEVVSRYQNDASMPNIVAPRSNASIRHERRPAPRSRRPPTAPPATRGATVAKIQQVSMFPADEFPTLLLLLNKTFDTPFSLFLNVVYFWFNNFF